MKRIFRLTISLFWNIFIFLLIKSFPVIGFCDDGSGFGTIEDQLTPHFYADSIIEGQSVCLGIILAENLKYKDDISDNYSLLGERFKENVESSIDYNEIFESKKFNAENAVAKGAVLNEDGAELKVYLFLEIDACFWNKNKDFYSYYIFKGDLGDAPDYFEGAEQLDFFYLDGEDFTDTDGDCNPENVTCSTFDISAFNEWINNLNENDSGNEDDEDDNDDDGCGCMVNRQGSGLTTFLVMVLIGCLFLALRKSRS